MTVIDLASSTKITRQSPNRSRHPWALEPLYIARAIGCIDRQFGVLRCNARVSVFKPSVRRSALADLLLRADDHLDHRSIRYQAIARLYSASVESSTANPSLRAALARRSSSVTISSDAGRRSAAAKCRGQLQRISGTQRMDAEKSCRRFPDFVAWVDLMPAGRKLAQSLKCVRHRPPV
jgi:hypothetical protein